MTKTLTKTEQVRVRCRGAASLRLEDLTPLQNGLKELAPADSERLRKSLLGNGFCFPFFVWRSGSKNYYLDGHQRDRVLRQMRKDGVLVPDSYPVAFVEAKTKAEAAKLILLQSSAYGKMSGTTLQAFAAEHALNLTALAPMLDLPHLNLQNLLDAPAAGETDPDAVPEPPKEAVTNPGDLWALGDHRLLCGSSTNPTDVSRVMGGGAADVIFTDPPYGVSIGAKNRFLNSFQRAGQNLTDIKDDDLKPETLKDKLLVPAFSLLRTVMSETCTVFVTAPQGGELGMMMMMMMMKEAGLPVRHVLIWKKNAPTFSMGRLDYDYQHEPILLTWGKKHAFYGAGAHKTSVWDIAKPRASADHPTMKPVELYVNAFQNNSKAGDTVYEPFSGSGTAIIASEQIGRSCRAIEIEPRYCDVAVRRWEEFTGRKAKLVK